MTVKEDLIKARAKIAAGWCQGVPARNAQGSPVYADSSAAVSFCIVGALSALGLGDYEYSAAYAALHARSGMSCLASLSRFNDTHGRTQEEVLALFDKAIACAQ